MREKRQTHCLKKANFSFPQTGNVSYLEQEEEECIWNKLYENQRSIDSTGKKKP